MSRIDDLIRDLCPNGVEHKTLGEVGEFIRGNGIKKSDFIKQGYPCIHYGQIHTHYGISAAETISHISPEQATRLRKAQPGDLIIATTSEDDDAVGKATAWLGTTPVAVGGDSYIFRHSMEPKYVSYFFSSATFSRQKQTHITGSKVRRIVASSLSKITIPAPPIEIQHEIARTLDQFIQLEAELEAELKARRQQYSHFANSITHSEHTITLGNIATFDYGLTAKAKDTGTHRFIRITDISPSGCLLQNNAKYVDIAPDSNRFIVNDQDILVARTGASYGKTLLVRSENPMSFASYLIRINLDPLQIDPEFYWHFTHSRDYWKQAASLVSKGGQQQFNSNALKRIKTPIPPLAQQREIAKSLNHLHSLAHDLTSGLPAEIEARRKQYEYYRDRLLTFPEKK